MSQTLLIDLLIGGAFGALVVSVAVPFVPAAYRGPRGAVLAWIGAIVVFSIVHRLWRRRMR